MRVAARAALATLLAAGACTEVDVPLRGEVTRAIADRDDGTTDVQYFLRGDGGRAQRLVFARDPGLAPYTPVEVWGRATGDDFAVSSYRVADTPPDSEPRAGALIGATPEAPRKFAFVLVDTGGGSNLTPAQAQQLMFDPNFVANGQGSVRRYYREASFDVQDITGDVYGPIAYTAANSCDTMGVTNLRAQIDQMAGGPSQHYLWYFGSRQTGCNFTGLAVEGTPDRPARDTWYNASTSCVVLVQEPGHNFGMQHSSSMICPNATTFADAPDGNCRHGEYGDPFDPMGSDCRHMNAWQKTFEGWMAGCNGVRVTASGTFTLLPIETPCNGTQVLQIPMPKTRPFSHSGGGGPASTDTLTSYYVELRTSVGFDQGLSPMVLVHVAGDFRSQSRSGLHTWLLDMVPTTASFRDAGLAVGKTFTDPAGGVNITVLSADATHASIDVQIANGAGAPTCLDGTTIAAPGPASCDGTAPATGEGGAAGVGAGGAGGALGSPGGLGGQWGEREGSPAPDPGCACATGGAAPAGAWPGLALIAALVVRGRRRGRPGRSTR